MNSFYFDYNATSPLAAKVIKRLREGEVDFFNPSSLHSPGRASLKVIREVEGFLLDLFSLTKTHDVFFHSGATEGINTFFSSCYDREDAVFIASPLDHSSVKESLTSWQWLSPTLNALDLVGEIEVILKKEKGKRKVFLNWTWLHNETGIVYSPAHLKELKKKYDLFIHMDAAQVIGKIEKWKEIPPWVDMISFSGHKFGALKGVGFSFIKREFSLNALIKGGGQQRGLRSGTLNTLGILSLKDALEDVLSWPYSFDEIKNAKEEIEEKVKCFFEEEVEILGRGHKGRNNNTIFLILKSVSSDRAFPFFDINNAFISRGAACSSGGSKKSETLKALGYDESISGNGLRISFIPYELPLKKEEFLEVIKKSLLMI